jgi:glyoxylate/hydroxypyruvate reductase A
MQIHVQNEADDAQFAITPEMWAKAGGPDTVSFGVTDAEFRQAMATSEALVTSGKALKPHREWIAANAAHVKLIFCTSAGLESLAPFDWLPEGATLLNNSGVHGTRAGEYVAMGLLMLAGHMPKLIAAQHAHRWEKHYGSILGGRTLAVLGTGSIGSAGARQARHFGMRTVGVRTEAVPHPDFDDVVGVADIDSVLPEADFLLLAAPLTPLTRGVITRDRLALLPKGAGVMNVGRGALMDQEALCDLLDAGHLDGAVLDVFVPEPIPQGHRLWTTRNLVITPHIAADDPKTYAFESVVVFLENLASHRKGEPMENRYDTVRGY